MARTDTMLSSWDSTKQETFRRSNPEQGIRFHLLLDMSPSMHAHAQALIRAYNLYLAWLQQHADPMSTVELVCFSTLIHRRSTQPLGLCKPLTKAVYDPARGNGTALYQTMSAVLSTSPDPGQHVLVVLTDGEDSGQTPVDHGQVFTLLTTLTREAGWLAVYLGAFAGALEEGKAMGFTPGNCLVFGSDHIPEAFQQLTRATDRYLAASVPERKLLAAQGVF